jgi:hypothetical protein
MADAADLNREKSELARLLARTPEQFSSTFLMWCCAGDKPPMDHDMDLLPCHHDTAIYGIGAGAAGAIANGEPRAVVGPGGHPCCRVRSIFGLVEIVDGEQVNVGSGVVELTAVLTRRVNHTRRRTVILVMFEQILFVK